MQIFLDGSSFPVDWFFWGGLLVCWFCFFFKTKVSGELH